MREPCAISTAAETASQSSQQSDECVHIFSQASCPQDVRVFASRHFPEHICPRPSFPICPLVFLMPIDWMRSVALDYVLLLVIKNFRESACTLYKHVSRFRRNQLPAWAGDVQGGNRHVLPSVPSFKGTKHRILVRISVGILCTNSLSVCRPWLFLLLTARGLCVWIAIALKSRVPKRTLYRSQSIHQSINQSIFKGA